MTTDDRFGRSLSAWLVEDGEHRVPDHLAEVLLRTAATRQRPWWSSLERWLPMDLTNRANTFAPLGFGRALLFVLLLLALVGAATIFVGTRRALPAPYGPAANGPILFADGDIKVAGPEGTEQRVLIGGPENDVAVLASNDGTRIVIWREVGSDRHDVLTANADGTALRVETEVPLVGASSGDWSPDGDEILIRHQVAGKSALSILAADGSRQIRTLALGDLEPHDNAWRPPDGREVVFRGSSPQGVALYAVSAAGGEARRLAPLERDPDAYLGARLSPDGTRVTFWHNRPVELTAAGEERKSEVHVLDLQTGKDVRIGYDPTSRHEHMPKFSPDGRSVAFIRFGGNPDVASLLIAPADGTGATRRIRLLLSWCCNPIVEFSPDGTKILISFGIDRRMQLIDVADGSARTIDSGDYPSWVRLAPVGRSSEPGPTPCPGTGCR
jgi:Tol biopolymer transport system component